jgi:hypothetical protein
MHSRVTRTMSEHRRTWVHRMTPAAAMRTRLVAAAVLWTTVGSVLAFVGVRWVLMACSSGVLRAMALVTAAMVGFVKSRVVFRRTAARVTARLLSQGDGRCFGGFSVVEIVAHGGRDGCPRSLAASLGHSLPVARVGVLGGGRWAYVGVGRHLAMPLPFVTLRRKLLPGRYRLRAIDCLRAWRRGRGRI